MWEGTLRSVALCGEEGGVKYQLNADQRITLYQVLPDDEASVIVMRDDGIPWGHIASHLGLRNVAEARALHEQATQRVDALRSLADLL